MSEEIDREIFEWLGGGCWHEWHKVQYHGIRERMACSKCGDYQRPATENPNYLDPATALSLLEAVRDRGYAFCITTDADNGQPIYVVRVFTEKPYVSYYAQADSLPEAIRAAVIKLVREGK
jgi:hypothetical protein